MELSISSELLRTDSERLAAHFLERYLPTKRGFNQLTLQHPRC